MARTGSMSHDGSRRDSAQTLDTQAGAHVVILRRLRSGLLRLVLRAWLRPASDAALERVGSNYGGWWIPLSALAPGDVAYCAGAGEDITFDLVLCEAGICVTTFDPTPRAIAHVEAVAPPDACFRFVAVGWWDEESTLRFYAPRNPEHVSHSALNLQVTSDYFVAKVKTVRALAEELGDARIDLIKMNIEGAETRVIGSLTRDGPLPGVLCVDFDQPQPLRGMVRAIRSLRGVGYEVAKIERWNFTFLRTADARG